MQQDISILNRQKRKKLSTVKQKKVVELLNNLFSSGFHLAEIIDFLKRSALLEKVYVEKMKEGLATGKPFSDIMASLGFSDNVVTQLSLAELHGNLSLSLSKIEEYLENISKVKKKLIEVATYPFILFIFLVFIMLGLRNYLLPQLESQNIATQLISRLPQIFLGSVGVVFALFAIGFYWFRKSSQIRVFSLLSRLPFWGTFVQTYLTAYYAREWGNMIGQGLELSQIFQMMQGQRSAMFQEIGKDLEVALQNGQEFSQVVKHYPFFKKELGLMIEYGEVKSKLGCELEVYAQKTWEVFFKRVHQAMNIIQPLVFVFVALMIVLLYAAMLLPIYQNMEVQL
ncbi:competence type IV pilus assembly protein ComGB [Streptococcus intermedius]|uniref:competence type IV pilus assembly protein ComGB n=1 Tax=Streptococcus intermedius TaxID=1338 RepID=UPI0018E1982F|nr:competence type IV pilus assembly protein ComGB [Streptococcus intermedius]